MSESIVSGSTKKLIDSLSKLEKAMDERFLHESKKRKALEKDLSALTIKYEKLEKTAQNTLQRLDLIIHSLKISKDRDE